MQILYVEDAVADADLAKRAFKRLAPEYHLEVVGTLAEGRERLASGNFDILLTDLKLPDGNGLELLTEVRQSPHPLPVVVLTGSGDQESAIAALKAGADDYLTKRDDYLERLPQRLSTTLHRHLSRQDARGRILRVLYAEHSLFDADLTCRHLAQHAPHIHLDVVNSGEAVLRHLHRDDYDVILLDYRLQGMDGLEVARVLRQEEGCTQPIVLTTGQGSEEIAALALHLGVNDYLSKHDDYLHALPATLEKAQRQSELARTSRRLEHLLTASPTILYTLNARDHSLHPTWVSSNISRILGYTPPEALTEGWWWNNLRPEDQEAMATRHDILWSQGQLSHEYRFRTRQGNTLWIRDEVRLSYDEQGHPLEAVGSWTDISTHKAGELLQESRTAVLDQILAGAPLGSILIDIAQRLEALAPDLRVAILLLDEQHQCLTLGAAPSLPAAYLATLEGLAPGDGRDFCNAAAWSEEAVLNTELSTSPCWSKLRELATLAGFRTCWAIPIKDEHNRTLGTIGIHYEHPCTPEPGLLARVGEFARLAALAVQKIRAAEALRKSAAVFECTRDGVIITDLAPRIVAVNRAWGEIFGYAGEEVEGRNPGFVKSGRHDEAFFQALWNSLLTRGEWQGEIWNRRKGGEIFPVWITLSTIRNEQGEPTHYVGVVTDITQLKRSEAQLEHLTHYDPLTDLPNRLLVQARLEHAIHQAGRQGQGIGVTYIDLDHFKNINDSLGHPAGDELLLAITQRIAEHLSSQDSLGRLGGDEFLIITENLERPDEAAKLAQTLLHLLNEPFLLPSGQEIYAGASIGLSLYPQDGTSATELIQRADTALYQAKAQGRNTYRFYVPELGKAVQQRLGMETLMRRALERGEFSLHYQPQVDIRSGRVCGLEALMRWQSPELGPISPGEFIPLAEQSGLILPMGTWALEAACRQNKTWQDMGLPPLGMAVNVSVRQFRDRNLLGTIQAVLAKTGLPSRYLELELTESAFMDDAETAIATTRQIRQLGVRLSLDDFGTGYSSLSYLSRFPFDKIKIDQSFVRDITENPTNAAIAIATIALADSLHMAVLAEGVETEAQLNFLRQRGCCAVQGFLFSRPLPAAECTRFLQETGQLALTPLGGEPPTLLLLDDEPNMLRALQRVLRQEGYRILATTNPREALEILAMHPIQVVVSDQRMPEMNGTEFFRRVKQLHPHTIRIVLSGFSDADAITGAINEGAIYKFLHKPWDDDELRHIVREAFKEAEKIAITQGGR